MAKPFVNPFVSGQFLELRVDALVSDGAASGVMTAWSYLSRMPCRGSSCVRGRRRAEEPCGSRTC